MNERLREFSHDGFTFAVLDEGPLDGIPVVLLHGFPQRASSWRSVAERLHASGHRTYAPDQRGYSPGARPRSRLGYRGAALIGDVEALIGAIDRGPVHLVGHDWGAAIAWGLAGQKPDLVRTLTAVSVPHPAAFMRSMVTGTQAFKSYYMLLFQLPWLPEWLLGRTGAGGRWLRAVGMTDAMVEEFRTGIVSHGALSGGLGWYRALPLADPGAIRAKVGVPTTYVWSDGDAALGRKGAELCEHYVTGAYEFVNLEGASHWIPDERPAELARLIEARIASV